MTPIPANKFCWAASRSGPCRRGRRSGLVRSCSSLHPRPPSSPVRACSSMAAGRPGDLGYGSLRAQRSNLVRFGFRVVEVAALPCGPQPASTASTFWSTTPASTGRSPFSRSTRRPSTCCSGSTSGPRFVVAQAAARLMVAKRRRRHHQHVVADGSCRLRAEPHRLCHDQARDRRADQGDGRRAGAQGRARRLESHRPLSTRR